MLRRGWQALFLLVLGAALARGDDPAAPPAAPASDWPLVLPLLRTPPDYVPPGNPVSNAGFIDPAMPWDIVRERFDALYHMNRPTRAQYFLAPDGPFQKHGFLAVERNVDLQELTTYVEYAILPTFSAFIDVPFRSINPTINPNTTGLANMHAGVKLAMLQTHDTTVTFQFRAYLPTGAPHRGLGNDEIGLEPGLLLNWQARPDLLLEGQVLGYFPVNDTTFGSEIVQYGLAASYGERSEGVWVAPVAELMGWSVVRGKENVFVNPKKFVTHTTSGDTIVNAFLGVRAGYGCLGDLYIGYGRALTGEVWYKNLFRIELRYQF